MILFNQLMRGIHLPPCYASPYPGTSHSCSTLRNPSAPSTAWWISPNVSSNQQSFTHNSAQRQQPRPALRVGNALSRHHHHPTRPLSGTRTQPRCTTLASGLPNATTAQLYPWPLRHYIPIRRVVDRSFIRISPMSSLRGFTRHPPNVGTMSQSPSRCQGSLAALAPAPRRLRRP